MARNFMKCKKTRRFVDVQTYQQVIGCLTYLSVISCPDIGAAVNVLSKYIAKPSNNHWIGVKRVLCYLKGTFELAKNPSHHSCTKHIDICHHFVRERISSKEIKVEYCPTERMIADIMTKALPKATFEKFRNLLNVYLV